MNRKMEGLGTTDYLLLVWAGSVAFDWFVFVNFDGDDEMIPCGKAPLVIIPVINTILAVKCLWKLIKMAMK